MYVEKIVLDEFRCFRHAEIEFNFPGKPATNGRTNPDLDNVTLLLGNNGAGKSAILKAVAWGALAQVLPSSGLRPYMFVRRDGQPTGPSKNSSVQAHLILHAQDGIASTSPGAPFKRVSQGIVQLVQDTEQFITTAVTDNQSFQPIFIEQSPAFFVAGYGATRRSEGSAQADPSSEKQRSLRYQRVASIFEDQVALLSTGVALSRLQATALQPEAIQILNALLPSDVQFSPTSNQPDGEFQVGNILLPSSQLSDGYRAFVAWTLDLLANLAQVAGAGFALNQMTGVVLVDEIDLHLHPSWQRLVVGTVARAFPNLQFIITSHSPLVTGTLGAANILFADKQHEFTPATANVQGLSSDQILTSVYFGLETPRSTEAVTKLSELATKAWSGDKGAGLEFLELLNKGVEGA